MTKFKIEAIDESGMFEDMIAERFETLEDAAEAYREWEYPDTVMHIIDIENQRVALKNYDRDPHNSFNLEA